MELENKVGNTFFSRMKNSLVGRIVAYSLATGLALGGVYGLSGCDSKEEKRIRYEKISDEKDEERVRDIIEKNFKYLNEENLSSYMGTVDPSSPAYESTRNFMKLLFDHCDVEASVKIKSVFIKYSGIAKITTEEDLSLYCDDGFTSTKGKSLHTLFKENGEWKIYDTEVLK